MQQLEPKSEGKTDAVHGKIPVTQASQLPETFFAKEAILRLETRFEGGDTRVARSL
jgi:hypothetical protein